MKTPREILLERHRAAEMKLDAVRRSTLVAAEKERPEGASISFRELLRSFRWHAVGMGAAWLFIMFLHLDASPAPTTMAAIPPAKIPAPQVILTSLRENRRQLSEMIEPDAAITRPLELFQPRPRSERRQEMLVV